MTLRIGAIAADFTGASDLALSLAREGMKVTQVIGVPAPDVRHDDADAVVVSLKSRTIPAAAAVEMSLAAARWLQAAGASQYFFKYCSTFDSTDLGNIGPVADALMQFLGVATTIACPAYPSYGRSIFKGHLFVGNDLLSESSMRSHPLTPMRDANLVRVLQRQTQRPILLVAHDIVRKGELAIAEALQNDQGIAIIDAVVDEDLRAIGAAVRDLKLVTGGSGIAIGLPANFGITQRNSAADKFAAPEGRALVLAGRAHQQRCGRSRLQSPPVRTRCGCHRRPSPMAALPWTMLSPLPATRRRARRPFFIRAPVQPTLPRCKRPWAAVAPPGQ